MQPAFDSNALALPLGMQTKEVNKQSDEEMVVSLLGYDMYARKP